MESYLKVSFAKTHVTMIKMRHTLSFSRKFEKMHQTFKTTQVWMSLRNVK